MMIEWALAALSRPRPLETPRQACYAISVGARRFGCGMFAFVL